MTAFLALALALQPARIQKPAAGSKTVSVQQLLPHIWRKTVSPGVMFEMVWDQAAGLTEFALRIDPKCPDVKLGCDLGGHTVYEDNPTIGRATVTDRKSVV